MLPIPLLRDDPHFVKTQLARRSPSLVPMVDALLTCDQKRRETETRVQQLRSERNRLSKEIGILKSRKQETVALEEEVKSFAATMEELQASSNILAEEQQKLLLQIPNLPHETIPTGENPSQNVVIREWGTPAPKNSEDHIAIGERLGLFDLDRATKLSGSGYVCFTGDGARLERALINFLLDLHTKTHGYTEMGMPLLVRREVMVGTGQLPKFEEEMYGFDEGTQFLTPTAEVSLTNFYREEILSQQELPLKLTACTPCFRRESGGAGRDTRGIIRMHQFHKVELVKICLPDQADRELESLTNDAERVLQLLELPYHVLELCTGDLGANAMRTYDLEVWAPGQGAFLEVSSCSQFGDYQARRMNLRYKDALGKNHYCHTLNGSGTALPRLYVALLETHTQPGGALLLPKPLHSYFGAASIG
ncbi:MAG: serine--tRNA ligase [Verrucomicrobia bacterium]|nr:MAG: serine--tRNA ligase [Verrucomicrobiota bacterium]